MNIKGLDQAEVLAALYNGSRQQGLGFLQARGAEGMTKEQAQKELDARGAFYFDYLHGRVMKVNVRDNELETRLYDRDNGEGAAERALAPLFAKRAA